MWLKRHKLMDLMREREKWVIDRLESLPDKKRSA
jgi:hypothetical protein